MTTPEPADDTIANETVPEGDEPILDDIPEDDDDDAEDDGTADEAVTPPVIGEDDDEAAEGSTEDENEDNGVALPDDPFDPANIR